MVYTRLALNRRDLDGCDISRKGLGRFALFEIFLVQDEDRRFYSLTVAGGAALTSPIAPHSNAFRGHFGVQPATLGAAVSSLVLLQINADYHALVDLEHAAFRRCPW
jgi:hypothetical protein